MTGTGPDVDTDESLIRWTLVIVARHFATRGSVTEAGNKVERLEDDVRRTISVRGLQFVAHVAVSGQRQTLFRDVRPADIPA